MSRSYFSTRFKEMTGETFYHYVIQRKMKAVAERIAEGKQSITQIAAGLGYDNFHYFARVFAREYGCTPAEYRKKVKNLFAARENLFELESKKIGEQTELTMKEYL